MGHSPIRVSDKHDKNLREKKLRKAESCSDSSSLSLSLKRSGINTGAKKVKNSRASPENFLPSKSLPAHNDRDKLGKKVPSGAASSSLSLKRSGINSATKKVKNSCDFPENFSCSKSLPAHNDRDKFAKKVPHSKSLSTYSTDSNSCLDPFIKSLHILFMGVIILVFHFFNEIQPSPFWNVCSSLLILQSIDIDTKQLAKLIRNKLLILISNN
ncbi:hypothetical protein MHK_007276 [Candidatus Magnetomorum sp. HK-1]|nr:hypothetical protein MHK_007276 [Candidatus Magnetomorum sp. HK-1]